MGERNMPRAIALCAALLLITALQAAAWEGTLRSEDGAPIPGAFIALTDDQWQGVGHAVTGTDGAFSLPSQVTGGHLIVQPPARDSDAGVKAFAWQPRIYRLPESSAVLDLRLPACGTVVLLSHGEMGTLERVADLTARGTYGGQFMYATSLDWNALPATAWHAHGELTGQDGGPREQGLPALCIAPGQRFAVWLLYWPTGHGKLMLCMDNAGRGFLLEKPGDTLALHVAEELARTAVANLAREQDRYGAGKAPRIAALVDTLVKARGIKDPVAREQACARVLDDALRLRDALEVEAARVAIPKVRTGRLEVRVRDAAGAPVAGARVEVAQEESSFLFGVFGGSPYDADAFSAAREAGFNFATVLPAWNWTENPRLNAGAIDQRFGISAMNALGYRVKAHGVIWMQDYGILPDRARAMPHGELVRAALEHQKLLMDVFRDRIDVWEAMNEPANTNVVGLPREDMIALLGEAAANIAGEGFPALVNSPHEFSYESNHLIHGTDNRPLDGYPMTFPAFLDLARAAGALDDIGIIGLQFYPGFHLNPLFGGLEGPAFTPSHLRDVLARYARFGKTLHITELSLPSAYPAGWNCGYWREEWSEAAQADYAEAAYTLAFADPQVRSVTWWDISDTGAAVEFGGLLREDGTPKPAFERLRALLAQWRTDERAETDTAGAAAFAAFGGRYRIRVTFPDGGEVEQEFQVLERWTNTVEVTAP